METSIVFKNVRESFVFIGVVSFCRSNVGPMLFRFRFKNVLLEKFNFLNYWVAMLAERTPNYFIRNARSYFHKFFLFSLP